MFSALFFLTTLGHSQTHHIEEVKFDPPNPQSKTTLKLYVRLFPSEEEVREVSIRLLTWRDLNNDCKYTAQGEELQHPIIRARNNDQGNGEAYSENEITIPIYEVPVDHPPQKYTAIVTLDGDSQSASITIPPKNGTSCSPSDSSLDWSLGKVLSIPFDIARRLRTLQDNLTRGDLGGDYQGQHSLSVYTLTEEKVEQLSHNAEALYLSPTWSSDSKKVTFIFNQDGRKTIAWSDVEKKNLEVMTAGPEDRDPFWLPDNTRIFFVRNRRLQVVDTKSQDMKAIASDLRVDRVLGVAEGKEHFIQVVFEAPNRYAPETKELYLLELDSILTTRSVSQLVNNPIWFLIPRVSPLGDQVVYGEENSLFIRHIDKERGEPLLKDEHRHFEPSWSPDGEKIVFVSDRS